MADLVPIITELADPATWDAPGIIDALNGHTFGAAWSIADYNAAQGIALKCDTAGENHTSILRKNASGDANHLAVSLTPSETVDDAGNDTPTLPTTSGATPMDADWSGQTHEVLWDMSINGGGSSPGSKLWVNEYPDALIIYITDPTNAFQTTLLYIGRIYQPILGSTVSLVGMDGLGILAGEPGAPTVGATVDALLSRSIGTDAGLLHYETNNWAPRTHSTALNPSGIECADGGDGEANTFTCPFPAQCDLGSQLPWIGVYKYYRVEGISSLPKVVQPVPSSNAGFQHIADSAISRIHVVLTDKTVTP